MYTVLFFPSFPDNWFLFLFIFPTEGNITTSHALRILSLLYEFPQGHAVPVAERNIHLALGEGFVGQKDYSVII